MKKLVFIVLFLCLFQFAFSQQIGFYETLNRFLQQPEYENATVGLEIVDLSSGEKVYELNSEQLMIPASTLKLVTSAAALELLGSDYRFETQIGYSGEVKDSILTGDLIIVGGGDPTLGSEYFEDYYFKPHFLEIWAARIKQYGIKEIAGDLVLDVSLYDSEINPPTWIWEDIGNYYGAGSSALTVYDNTFRITFRSPRRAGRQTEIINVSPEIQGIQFDNEVLSADINYDQAYVFGSPFDFNRVIRGAIPANRSAFTIKAAIPHPEKLLASELIKKMVELGITVAGDVIVKNVDNDEFHPLYIQYSQRLAEIIKVMNFESVNLYAEHLVRQIAAEAAGAGSREDGIELIKEFWETRGINQEHWFMEDGSGLSHFNAISPHHFTTLLRYMNTKSPEKDAFINSLASPGEGTLVYWDRQQFPGSSLRAKSGSMTRVRCYSGYLTADSGADFTFSIMVNHFGGSNTLVIQQIEELLLQLKNEL